MLASEAANSTAVGSKIITSIHDFMDEVETKYRQQNIDLRHSNGVSYLIDLIKLYKLIEIVPNATTLLNDELPSEEFFTQTVFTDIPIKWQHFHFERAELYYFWSLIENRLMVFFKRDILPLDYLRDYPNINLFNTWLLMILEGCKYIDELIWNFELSSVSNIPNLYNKLIRLHIDGSILQVFLDNINKHFTKNDLKKTSVFSQSYIILRFQRELAYYPNLHPKIDKPLIKLVKKYDLITFKKLAQSIDVNNLNHLCNHPVDTPVPHLTFLNLS